MQLRFMPGRGTTDAIFILRWRNTEPKRRICNSDL